MTPTTRIPLTDEQLNERRDKLAHLIHERGVIEQAKKDASSEFRLQLEAIEIQINETAKEIRERCTWQPAQMSVEDELAKARARREAEQE